VASFLILSFLFDQQRAKQLGRARAARKGTEPQKTTAGTSAEDPPGAPQSKMQTSLQDCISTHCKCHSPWTMGWRKHINICKCMQNICKSICKHMQKIQQIINICKIQKWSYNYAKHVPNIDLKLISN